MADRKTLQIPDMITVGDLADKLGIPVVKLVGELFKNGIMATVNQRIDFETAEIIIEELGIDVKIVKKDVDAVDPEKYEIHLSKNAKPRPPIVAVMGHVDHGKTTLLDNILGMKKASGEAGGITQHISAYQTVHNGRTITLLDTPGHEAFAALRQHGATLTDVVVIVVAADDGVKPQTVEAIKFARSANAKIVVAINKMDKPTANPNLVKTQLASEYDLNPEEWGGDTVMVEVSALTGQNVDKLLDMVLLVADMEELKADYNVPAEGLVIESNLEKGRGAVVHPAGALPSGAAPYLHLRGRGLGQPSLRSALSGLLSHRASSPGPGGGTSGAGALSQRRPPGGKRGAAGAAGRGKNVREDLLSPQARDRSVPRLFFAESEQTAG